MKAPAAIALVFLLAACGSSQSPTVAAPVAVAPSRAPDSEPTVSLDSTETVEGMPLTSCDPGEPLPKREGDVMSFVDIEEEGISVFVPGAVCVSRFPFGASSEVTISGLVQAFEIARAPDAMEDECGGEVYIFDVGLVLHGRDGKFLGWSLREGSPIETPDEIGLGTTREEIAKLHTIDMLEDSTLGDEFSIGGIAGLFASDAKDAKITHLWAGETCIAR